jgi:hypothetical protein
MSSIKYIKGMKYCLSEDTEVYTPIRCNYVRDKWFVLEPNGKLIVYAGFCWDGPSGPTFDTKDSMRASLVHDVFCIMMRDGRLSYTQWQNEVNSFFEQQCIMDGMSKFRARLWYFAVELGDAGNPTQGPDREVHEAP